MELHTSCLPERVLKLSSIFSLVFSFTAGGLGPRPPSTNGAKHSWKKEITYPNYFILMQTYSGFNEQLISMTRIAGWYFTYH